MQNRVPAVLILVVVLIVGLLSWLWLRGDAELAPVPGGQNDAAAAAAAPAQGSTDGAVATTGAGAAATGRESVAAGGPPTGVRGIVLDAKTGQPLGGVEVVAIKEQPSLEPLIARFRGLFAEGMFVETRSPRHELGRTVSNPDGTFEITGLPAGRVFLDGRSDAWFVRTPGTARLAAGEIRDGIELRAAPGGRVRGVVLGPDGAPAAGAEVSLRPGLNAFFGQLTERQYRWLETVTDEHGRFDIPGVPAGSGYTATAAAKDLALEEQNGVEVRTGQVTELTLQSHRGGLIAGRVVDGNGAAVAGANVAMIYLDISRVLLSADGRAEPIATDANGAFRIEHVAAGRVAFVAMAQDQAPSNIQELAVVDGGIYDDVVLQVGEGATVRGTVVDDQKQPVAGAAVELRPFEGFNDPQFLNMMLRIRRVTATTAVDGTFVARGLTGERLVIQASKVGYTTAMKFGVKLDEPALVIEVQRGAVVRGKVTADGKALTRFRVDTRTRPIPQASEAKAGEPVAVADASDDGGGPPWRRNRGDNAGRGGFQMRFGPGGGPGGPMMREGTTQLPEGQKMMDRGMDGNWREIQSADGTFELRGIPPGRIRVRVRAEGYLDAKEQTVDLQPAQTSDVLAFEIAAGVPVHGVVLDAETRQPVSDAQVTAYRQRDNDQQRRRGLPFQVDIDPEDFDFLGLSSATNQRSGITDSKGRFTLTALEAGKYRFTARHPDMAKASTKDVEVLADQPTPDVEIQLDSGGGVEGNVTGYALQPLADALMVAFSIQTGTMRSSTTDKGGYYRIDGLPPGQYIVFKSRMDERADNIGLELMTNMRLKTVTVKKGRFTRLDVHDEGDDGVRIHGFVRENGTPVPRALVTVLGSDRDGLLGMGVRAGAADLEGRYELLGIKPGSYVMQVTRFLGQPVQTTFEIEVPAETRDYPFDITLPTSEIAGRVIDTRGNPVAGIQVTLGSDEGALSSAEGLVGLIAQNGLSQARTDGDGNFRLKSVSAGRYVVTAGSRFGRGPGGRPRGDNNGNGNGDQVVHGEARQGGLVVDGASNLEGVVVTVPIAGRITGLVVDGSGQPVAGAEITAANTSEPKQKKSSNPMLDLLGASRGVRTGDDGRFELTGLNPGEYDLRAEKDGALDAAVSNGVQVAEDAAADVTMHLVRGARIRVRATNVDKQKIPLASVSLLDGRGKPVVKNISTLSVMRRLMANRDEVQDSGWYEFGSVPPDTYTLVITEKNQPELRITRTITDGETVEWDVDVAAELAARDRAKK
ncbi:MAG: carboxypeptidase-like regulatory domain-containing protein [Planctomycetota bacterium]